VFYLDDDDHEYGVIAMPVGGAMGLVQAIRCATFHQWDRPDLTYVVRHAITGEDIPVRRFAREMV
jgi:hypothetical protein